MNWVIFSVLTGLIVFNLLGVGIYHYEYKQDNVKYPDKWKTDGGGFWKWTICLLLFGTAYCVIRFIVWIRDIIVENRKDHI